MSKLKTLKESEEWIGSYEQLKEAVFGGARAKLFSEYHLKKTAVEWVKELEKIRENVFSDYSEIYSGEQIQIKMFQINGKIDFIKHFFNLKEIDLK